MAVMPLAGSAQTAAPITLKPGDVISSSVLNSLFTLVYQNSQLPSVAFLIGTWNCTETLGGQWLFLNNGSGGNYTIDASGLFATRTNTYTFQAGASPNALTLTTSNGYPLWLDATPWNNYPAAIAPNTRLMTTLNLQAPSGRVPDTDYLFTSVGDNVFTLIQTAAVDITGTCHKTSIPPLPVNGLTAAVTGQSVALAWTDANTDQTGYVVQRSSNATWTTISTISSAATVSYTDTGLAAGTYQYQVLATNSYGTSIGSSVVQSVIP